MQEGIKYWRQRAVIYLRKYISVILISIFLFDIGGYYFWFCIWQNNIQKEIRQEIRNGLEEDDLVLIIAPINGESGISWIEPNKEFRYKGEMYDVVKIKIQNQNKYYYCIKDIKEKQLIASYNKNHNPKKEAGKKIREFKYQYIPQQFSLTFSIYTSDLTSATIVFLYKSKIIDIHSPPPKSVNIF